MNISTNSSEETKMIAQKLGKTLKGGLICLYGNLGAGKTTFVRGLALGLGIRSRVQSPTYTYQRVHFGKTKLYHFDLYRLNGESDLMLQEIFEALDRKDGVVVIEWPEKLEKFLPKERMEITFEYIDETKRKLISYD